MARRSKVADIAMKVVDKVVAGKRTRKRNKTRADELIDIASELAESAPTKRTDCTGTE